MQWGDAARRSRGRTSGHPIQLRPKDRWCPCKCRVARRTKIRHSAPARNPGFCKVTFSLKYLVWMSGFYQLTSRTWAWCVQCPTCATARPAVQGTTASDTIPGRSSSAESPLAVNADGGVVTDLAFVIKRIEVQISCSILLVCVYTVYRKSIEMN